MPLTPSLEYAVWELASFGDPEFTHLASLFGPSSRGFWLRDGELDSSARTLRAITRAYIDRYNITVFPSPDAPATWEGLVKDAAKFGRERRTVFDGASDNTIYRNYQDNYNARALHDYLHLLLGVGFDLEGETEVAISMAFRTFDAGAAALVLADTIGQVEYHQKWGQFPTDQREFVVDYLLTPSETIAKGAHHDHA